MTQKGDRIAAIVTDRMYGGPIWHPEVWIEPIGNRKLFIVSKSYSKEGMDRDFPDGALVIMEATDEFEDSARINEIWRIWKLVRK